MSLLKQADTTWSQTMIEAFTIDYNRVESSTATEDGDRIVVTLDSDNGPTNISLPTSEAQRLLTAVVTAAGMAAAAQKGARTLMVLGAPTSRFESIRPKTRCFLSWRCRAV